jgi:hypothetical protein
MKFISLAPFVPSGPDFAKAKQLFIEIGFDLVWEQHGLAGFEKEECKFILQNYNDKHFAENLMLNIKISNAQEFYNHVIDKKLPEKFGIRITNPKQQPYGIEVNVIDIAGVCWHFVE